MPGCLDNCRHYNPHARTSTPICMINQCIYERRVDPNPVNMDNTSITEDLNDVTRRDQKPELRR